MSVPYLGTGNCSPCWALPPSGKGPRDLRMFLASAAKDVACQCFEAGGVEEFELAALDVQQLLVLEAAEDAAHCLGREPQVVGDVGARHGEGESRRGESALLIATRH